MQTAAPLPKALSSATVSRAKGWVRLARECTSGLSRGQREQEEESKELRALSLTWPTSILPPGVGVALGAGHPSPGAILAW